MEELPHSTQADAIDALLAKSKRQQAVPIRRSFLQQPRSHNTRPGPLHQIVRNHDERALDLYLLVHLVAVGSPYKVTLEAGGWARALGLSTPSGMNTVSRTWRRLAELQLITRARETRMASITLLCEDGSGAAYKRPSGNAEATERYLRIPLEYWRQRWYRRLSLPAKAMLLIALSLRDGFYLPAERVPGWYGISADTAQRGLTELQDVLLLTREVRRKKAPLTTQGWTVEYRYTLQPPFGPKQVPDPGAASEDDAS